MIVSKTVEVKGNSRNINFYKKKGYSIKVNEIINVDVKDLTKGSTSKITIKCDKCSTEKITEYRTYINYIKKSKNDKYYCNKCKSIKTKKTNLKKYGVEAPLQNKEILDKVKKTNLKKWGNTCTLYSDKLKDVVREKINRRYKENKEKIILKAKKTNLSKYGVESPLQNKEILNKVKKTNLKKYGVENVFESDDIQNKIKQNNLEKWGVEYNYQRKDIKEKIKKTNLERYGNTIFSRSQQFLKRKSKELDLNYSTFKLQEYISGSLFKFKSNECNHIFVINKDNYNYRKKVGSNLCTICNKISDISNSNLEKKICNTLDKYKIKYEKNNRSVLNGKEIDIYIPSKKLAIECNGLYWHSELYKDKNYHINKTLKCKENRIQLLHIFEDDIILKYKIIESMIKNKLGKIENKIYARSCRIKKVNSKQARKFLNENHIQGFSRSKYKIGLYHNSDLVSLMTFGYRKTNTKKEFELIRFCNKINTSVLGSASKLFKYFIKKYKNEIDYILSYADISIFNGDIYQKLGFDFIHRTKPNYFWVIDGVKQHRFKYNKKKLVNEGYDSSMTEVDIMHKRGYYRIFSCGQDRYEYHFE